MPTKILQQKQPKLLKILAFDPGYSHFAFAKSIIKNNKIIIRKVGFVSPVDEMDSNFIKRVQIFQLHIQKLIKNIDYIVVERYLPRGRFSKAEFIILMIGILSAEAAKLNIPVYIITPALWKNTFIRTLQIKGKDLKFERELETLDLPEHIADAIGMTMFIVHKQYNHATLRMVGKHGQQETKFKFKFK